MNILNRFWSKTAARRMRFLLLLPLLFSCSGDILEERPLAFLNSDAILTSKGGFESYLVALVQAAREEMTMDDLTYYSNLWGTDVAAKGGAILIYYENYETYLTPANAHVTSIWDWAYTRMILRANTIVSYANKIENSGIWANEAEKNAVIAEARFFRGYTYNLLANLFGGVPIVDTVLTVPKTDFVKSDREEVYRFAKNDLAFAAEWLPATVEPGKEGRIVKAAASHLLSEVCISLGEYDNAIKSASDVIESGLYRLMTERFGANKDVPGDAFSDLFIQGNQNRSAGNMESIYVWQFKSFVQGGGGSREGNSMVRNLTPFLVRVTDPNGAPGMVVSDSLGRGVGHVRFTDYFYYDIWKNGGIDMRNSPYNIRRVYYYNNPASAYYGKPVGPKTSSEDTMRHIYPYIRKVEGNPWNNDNASGLTDKNVMVYRLAETYLLRAEAYLRKGDAVSAAADINTVRARATAGAVAPSDVTLDYILDERARELITEEPRRRTLIRMGKLVERVRRYNFLPITQNTIQEKHAFFPIPQTAIDANLDAALAQNPGY